MLNPSKIVCVGRNYREHARELGNEVPKEPLLFLKPPSSIIRDGEPIRLHSVSKHIEFEGEIGLVLGRRLTRATEDEAKSALAQVVALNDVTARDLQKSDGQWARAKGMDTFCPVGIPATAPSDLIRIPLPGMVSAPLFRCSNAKAIRNVQRNARRSCCRAGSPLSNRAVRRPRGGIGCYGQAARGDVERCQN